MSINVDFLQELESREEIGLEDCPILGSCCVPFPTVTTWTIPTVATCFGCTFSS